MSGEEGRKWARQIDHTVQERVKGTKGIKDRVTDQFPEKQRCIS